MNKSDGKEAKILRESPGERKPSEDISLQFRVKLYQIYGDFRPVNLVEVA